jgi:hypothetical protein
MIGLGHGWPVWVRSVPGTVALLIVGTGAVWAAPWLVPAFRIDGSPTQRAAGAVLTVAVLMVLGFGPPVALLWLLGKGTAWLLSHPDPEWDDDEDRDVDAGPLGCLVGAVNFVIVVAMFPWLPYAFTVVGRSPTLSGSRWRSRDTGPRR